MSVEFKNVKLRGGEGTLELTADKITFQPTIQTRKALSWPWSAVKSHQEVIPSFKPSWSMTVAVRGTITEQILFVLPNANEVKRLQREATARTALGGSNAPSPASLGGGGDSGPPRGPKKSSKLEEIKRQMAAQQTTAQKEAEAQAKKNKTELGGLGSAGVGDIRKKLGGKLPGRLRVPDEEEEEKGGPKPPPQGSAGKIDAGKRSALEGKLFFKPPQPPRGKEGGPGGLDPAKKSALEGKLAFKPPRPPTEEGGPGGLDPAKKSALEGKLAFKPPRPPPGSDDGPSAFSKVPPSAGEKEEADTSKVVRPKPMFLAELTKTVPKDAERNVDEAVQASQSTSKSQSKSPPQGGLMAELAATLAGPKKTKPPRPPSSSADDGAVPQLASVQDEFSKAKQDSLRQISQGTIPKIPSLREEFARAKRESQRLSQKDSAAMAAAAAPPEPQGEASQLAQSNEVASTAPASEAKTVVATGQASASGPSARSGSEYNNASGSSGSWQEVVVEDSGSYSGEQFEDENVPPQLPPSTSQPSSSGKNLAMVPVGDGRMAPQTMEELNTRQQQASEQGAVVPQDRPDEFFEDEGKNALVVRKKEDTAIVPSKKDTENAITAKKGPDKDEKQANTGLIVFLVCMIIVVGLGIVLIYFLLLGDDNEDDEPSGDTSPPSVPTIGGLAPTLMPVIQTFVPTVPPATMPASDPALSPNTPAPTAVGQLPGTTTSPSQESGTTTSSPTSDGTSVLTIMPSPPTFSRTSQPSFAASLMPTQSRPANQTTMTPTQSDTLAPQSQQTSAPTVLQTAGLVIDFPSFTQEAFEDSNSPQSQALNWLRGDPALSSYPDWQQRQRFALATFYYSMNGPNWPAALRDSWMQYDNGNECDWWGSDATSLYLLTRRITITIFEAPIVCNEDGRYFSLGVYDGSAVTTVFHQEFVNNFVGTLPPEVSLLTSLESILLQTDVEILGISMSELLPEELQFLEKLTELDLSNCYFSEWDFSVISQLPSLASLDLSYSDLDSTMPSELGLLTQLTELDLSFSYRLAPSQSVATRNGATIIPSEMGLLTSLNVLSLSGNRLSGAFPPELGALDSLEALLMSACNLETFPPTTLSNLQRLDVSLNAIEGRLPSEFGLFKSLQYLDASSNRLSGLIPTQFGLLPNLDSLNLIGNSLSGSLPAELGQASMLQVIDLARNDLAGGVPFSLFQLPNLRELNIGSNQFTGTLPPEIGLATQLDTLVLKHNQFTGTFPQAIGKLSKLVTLDFPMNLFSGTVPWTALAFARGLSYFDGSDNNLEGTIDSSIGSMVSLKSIYLQGNDFEGSLPTQISLLKRLNDVDLSQNRITGLLPSELGLLGNSLHELILDWNLIESRIPTEVGMLTKLETLSLKGYTLVGQVPEEIGNLAALESLLLSGNALIGSIPTTLGLLTALKVLSFELTTISGLIPSELGNLSSLTDLYLNATDLAGPVPTEICDLSSLENFWVDCDSVLCTCASCTCG